MVMGADRPGDLTALLDEVRTGRADSRDRLVAAIYGQLRRIAGGLMRRERPGHTLQPSALVHEALLRLLDGDATPGSATATVSASPWTRSWLASMSRDWT